MTNPEPPPGTPTAPLELAGGAANVSARIDSASVTLGTDFLQELGNACADISVDVAERGEAGRDWWPLAMVWATLGEVVAIPGAIARPTTVAEVSAVLALCNREGIPVTAAGGRSSVVGGAVALFGGVLLDLCGLSGIESVNTKSMTVEVLAGTFGDSFEEELQKTHKLTVGHWPQSMALATVGGWLACRGAGQMSNRYGKIEDIVVALEVVLADGTVIYTGGQPRQAVGPDLNQLFVGSEGTLGVITRAWLRAHHLPTHTRQAAYGFGSLDEGLDAMRRITQRGATPAVMRLYDATESEHHHGTDSGINVLLVLDEGDPGLVDAGMEIVAQECKTAQLLPESLVEHWMVKRNEIAPPAELLSHGLVFDTMEVAGPWSELPAINDAAKAAIGAVPGTVAVTVHQSHSYITGGCLYFTLAGMVEPDERDEYYASAWEAGTRAVLENGGALSHHHGVGINRARFVADALGPAFDTLIAIKSALDPVGILNPAKLGFPSHFGELGWP